MGRWGLRWRILDKGKLLTIARALADMPIDFSRYPGELIFRNEREEKTDADRGRFHAICADIAPHWAETPGRVKEIVKIDFYGAEFFVGKGKLTEEEAIEFRRLLGKVGHYDLIIKSSEDSEREEYLRLTDHALLMAADSGVNIPDRRKR